MQYTYTCAFEAINAVEPFRRGFEGCFLFAELCLVEVPLSATRLTDLFKDIEREVLLLAVSPLLASFLIARPFSNFLEAFKSPLASLLGSK